MSTILRVAEVTIRIRVGMFSSNDAQIVCTIVCEAWVLEQRAGSSTQPK